MRAYTGNVQPMAPRRAETIHHNPSFGGEEFTIFRPDRMDLSNPYSENAFNSSDNYVNTTKSEDKNQMMLGSKLKELFKISKNDDIDIQPSLAGTLEGQKRDELLSRS